MQEHHKEEKEIMGKFSDYATPWAAGDENWAKFCELSFQTLFHSFM